MVRVYILIFIIIPNILLSQSQVLNEIDLNGPNLFSVIKNQKSLTNFSFNIPNGFEEYDEGKKSSTIMIFKEKSEGGFLNTMVFKVNDFPKYKKLSSMSRSEINQMILSRSKEKSVDPNQFSEIYEKNNRLWLIAGTFSVEKNFYAISCSLFSNKQIIMFNYLKDMKSNIKENIKNDIKMFKDLIDSFKEY